MARDEPPRGVSAVTRPSTDDDVAALFARREAPVEDLAGQAGAVAATCHAMAVRFHQGGKLVEFVHPVIVGKRALPAISLTADVATVTGLAASDGIDGIFAHQIGLLAEPADIALGIAADGNSPSVLRGLEAAKRMGMLTIALTGGGDGVIGTSPAVDHVLVARSGDPRVVKEVHVTTYHVLWELVHVFFEQPGVLTPGMVT